MLPPPGPLPPIIAHRTCRAGYFTPGRALPVQAIVLHNTEGVNSLDWLSGASPLLRPVSIHVLVSADGTRHNVVDYGDTAYHVGTAKRPYLNANTLGLELENPSTADRAVPYPAVQIAVAAHCVATWLFSYGLGLDALVRHGDIALPLGRRTDPNHFPLPRFLQLVVDWGVFFRALPAAEHRHWIV
jgi:N-acetyl-anhydromuramyl-L-alanine amidase AmpD